MKKHPATPRRAVKPENDLGQQQVQREGLNPRDAAFFFSSDHDDLRDTLRHQQADEQLNGPFAPKTGTIRGLKER